MSRLFKKKTTTAAAASYGAAVLFCVCFALPAHAAWTREQGKVFTAQTLTRYSTDRFIDNNGTEFPEPEFRKYEWNSYWEYGWRDGTTIGANLFLHRLSNDRLAYIPTSNRIETLTEDNYGLADSEFFLRQRLWQGELLGLDSSFAVQPLIKLPSIYLDAGNPRSGTEDIDAELRLQAGASFTTLGHKQFLTQDIAYRKRTGGWHNQWKFDFTHGAYVTDRLLLLSQFYVTQQVGGDGMGTSNATANDYDLRKAQVSLVYRLTDRIHIQLGGFTHVHARNTGDGDGVLFSLWQEF